MLVKEATGQWLLYAEMQQIPQLLLVTETSRSMILHLTDFMKTLEFIYCLNVDG